MSRVLTRFADGMLARLVPHTAANAGPCVVGKTVWRYCYCRNGLRIGQPCYYFRHGDDLICGCFACQAVIGAC